MASAIRTDQMPLRDTLFHVLPTAELGRETRSLGEIITKFAKWDDTLSIQIHEWYEEICSMDMGDSPSLTRKISQLVCGILVNPITGAPLKHPILDGYTVWEASTLEECKEFTKNSPVTKEPFEAVERVHEFALAILSWIEPFRAVAPSIREKPQRLFAKQEHLSSQAIVPYSSWALMPHEEKIVAAIAIYGRLGASISSQRTWQQVRREGQRLVAGAYDYSAKQEAQSKASAMAASEKVEGQKASYAQAIGSASAEAKLKSDAALARIRESAEKEAAATKAANAAASLVTEKSRQANQLATDLAGMRA